MWNFVSIILVMSMSSLSMANESFHIVVPARIMESHQEILNQIANSSHYQIIETEALKNDAHQAILRDLNQLNEKISDHEKKDIIESISLTLNDVFKMNVKNNIKSIREAVDSIKFNELTAALSSLNISQDTAMNFNRMGAWSISLPAFNEYGIQKTKFNIDTTEIEICTRLSSNNPVAQDDEVTIIGYEICSGLDPLDTELSINTTYNLLMAPLNLGNAQFDIEEFLVLAQRHHNGSFYGENLPLIGAPRDIDQDLIGFPQPRNEAMISL